MMTPLLGQAASVVFALGLLFAGIASSATAGIAGGSIFAGIYGKLYNTGCLQSRIGVRLTLIGAVIIIFFVEKPFQGPAW